MYQNPILFPTFLRFFPSIKHPSLLRFFPSSLSGPQQCSPWWNEGLDLGEGRYGKVGVQPQLWPSNTVIGTWWEKYMENYGKNLWKTLWPSNMENDWKYRETMERLVNNRWMEWDFHEFHRNTHMGSYNLMGSGRLPLGMCGLSAQF